MLPDVRFKEGHQRMIEKRNLILDKMDFKEVCNFLKDLYEDLNYYQRQADNHASIGTTDDARRVRRLERELQEVENFLNNFPFISLEKDGSISFTRKLKFADAELLFNEYKKSFDNDNPLTFVQGQSQEEKLRMITTDLSNQYNQKHSNLKQCILSIVTGVFINFLSPFFVEDPQNKVQEQNSYINSSVNIVVHDESRVTILCNDLELRKKNSNDSEIITKLHGIFNAKIIKTKRDWIFIEINNLGTTRQGWLPKHVVLEKSEELN